MSEEGSGQAMGVLTPRRVPEAYVRAEVASYPLTHLDAFRRSVMVLEPGLAGRAGQPTRELWRECEKSLSEHASGWSLDRLIAVRDFFWFIHPGGLGAGNTGRGVSLSQYLRHLAEAHLELRPGVTEVIQSTKAETVEAISALPLAHLRAAGGSAAVRAGGVASGHAGEHRAAPAGAAPAGPGSDGDPPPHRRGDGLPPHVGLAAVGPGRTGPGAGRHAGTGPAFRRRGLVAGLVAGRRGGALRARRVPPARRRGVTVGLRLGVEALALLDAPAVAGAGADLARAGMGPGGAAAGVRRAARPLRGAPPPGLPQRLGASRDARRGVEAVRSPRPPPPAEQAQRRGALAGAQRPVPDGSPGAAPGAGRVLLPRLLAGAADPLPVLPHLSCSGR